MTQSLCPRAAALLQNTHPGSASSLKNLHGSSDIHREVVLKIWPKNISSVNHFPHRAALELFCEVLLQATLMLGTELVLSTSPQL